MREPQISTLIERFVFAKMFKITKKYIYHNNRVLFIRIRDDFKQGGEKQLVPSQLDQPFG